VEGLEVLENKKIGDSNKTNSIDFFIILKFKINKKVKLLCIGCLIFVLVFITAEVSGGLQRKNKSGNKNYNLTPFYIIIVNFKTKKKKFHHQLIALP